MQDAQQALDALQLLRRGRFNQSLELLRTTEVQAALIQLDRSVWKEFHDWAISGELKSWQLARILRLELAVKQLLQQPSMQLPDSPVSAWGDQLRQRS